MGEFGGPDDRVKDGSSISDSSKNRVIKNQLKKHDIMK